MMKVKPKMSKPFCEREGFMPYPPGSSPEWNLGPGVWSMLRISAE